MAKRTVYICDVEACGAVLVHPDDGYVITGVIRPTSLEPADAKDLIAASAGEVSLCRECMLKALHLPT